MSLDVYLTKVMPSSVFKANYTNNVTPMAEAAGLYDAVWRPEEVGIKKAGQLIEPLRRGIAAMEANPSKFKALNPENGWGSYDTFLPWLKLYLDACEAHPDADVEVSR